MEMGRRWTPENLPATELEDLALDLAAGTRAARLLQYRPVPPRADPARLRGGRRVHHVCQHAAGPRETGSGRADRGPAWRTGRRRCRGTTRPRCACWGSRRTGSGSGGPHPEAGGRGSTGSATPSIAREWPCFEGPEGEAGGTTYPDPYFGGEGPERTTCIGCGGCMMGCRYNAKNTLDKNYLYLAEKRGARVFAETKVVDVRPLEWQTGRERRIRGVHVSSTPFCHASDAGASPAAAWSSRLRRWARWIFCSG